MFEKNKLIKNYAIQFNVDVSLEFYLIRHTEQEVDAGAVEGKAPEALLATCVQISSVER